MTSAFSIRDGCYLAENVVTAASARRLGFRPFMFCEADGPEQISRLDYPLVMVARGQIVAATDTDGQLWAAK